MGKLKKIILDKFKKILYNTKKSILKPMRQKKVKDRLSKRADYGESSAKTL